MSNTPVTWPQRLRRPLLTLLAALLGLGAATALACWWLWPPRPYAVLPDSDSASRIEFSPDGTLLAGFSGQDTTALVWETATGRLRYTLSTDEPVAVFSPDGKLLAVRGERLKLFDLATGEERPLALTNPGAAYAAFSPDGKSLLIMGSDGTASLVDLATGAQSSPLQAPHLMPAGPGPGNRWEAGPAARFRFSPDGGLLLLEGVGRLRVFDVAARRELASYPGAAGQLAFSPDGKTWAVAAGRDVRLRDAASGEERAVLRGRTDPVTVLAWSPDGKRLASLASGMEVTLWDVARGQELAATVLPGPTYDVYFSPDGRFLCMQAAEFEVHLRGFIRPGGSLQLWDTSALPPRHVASVTREQVDSPDGRVLAMIGDPDVPVRPWTIARRLQVSTWGSSPAVPNPIFTPDGKMVVLEGQTATVRGQLGAWLARGATGGNGYQFKWVDVDTWQERAVLDTDGPGTISPDGRLLATGGGDKPVKLWSVPPRRPLWPPLALAALVGVLVVVAVRYRRRRRGRAAGTEPVRGLAAEPPAPSP